jgi:hypothetical protein
LDFISFVRIFRSLSYFVDVFIMAMYSYFKFVEQYIYKIAQKAHFVKDFF